ncbi:MAG: helix-turn-helix domain-containing protein [Bacillota bacterium]
MSKVSELKVPNKLIKCAENYASATMFECSVIDSSGCTIYSTNNFKKSCFCEKVGSNCSQNISCERAHQYGSFQSFRFAGKYVYFCPLGLVHWTSAYITEDDRMYAILCGPVQLVEPDEFILSDFLKKHGINENLQSTLLVDARDIPVVSSERLDCLSDLLMASVIYHGGRNLKEIQDDKGSLEQQSNIWSYVSGMKFIWDDDNSQSYPIEKEKELLLLISSGNVAAAKEVLNEILGSIFFTTGDFQEIRSRVFELVVLLSRASMEAGAEIEEIFGLEQSFLDQLQKISNIEELTVWLSRTLERFNKSIFTLSDIKHSDLIYKVINYVKKSYMNRITLNDVSELVKLSPTYFSRIFKHEMNESFITWLNKYRIEKSKKFLLDGTASLIDVAGLSGYEDQSYFNKVFKKHTGITPGRFKESRGRASLSMINII